MAKLVFQPIADQITSGTYLLYDGACGTGGMLTVAEETLQELAAEHGKEVATHLYGQEINAETFAICKADLLLKGEGEAADNIVGGPEHSTLSNDANPGREFDFMLSNPPYGKSWKTDLERMGGKRDMRDPRFVIEHAGDPEYSLVTRSSDGQMLFLANKLSKMKQSTALGSRIAEVHNGSSLFTGDAGQGESNIRRWIIENDWLEAIVALPLNMFYNTGIATYVWVLTNRKPEHRRGKVQLIDATGWHRPSAQEPGQEELRTRRGGHRPNLRHLPRLRGDRAKQDLRQRRLRILEGHGRASPAHSGSRPQPCLQGRRDQEAQGDRRAQRDRAAGHQEDPQARHRRRSSARPVRSHHRRQAGRRGVRGRPICATPSRSLCRRQAASKPSCDARFCPTPLTLGTGRTACEPVTRSASPATSTNRCRCARWERSVLTSWCWRRRRRDYWTRSSRRPPHSPISKLRIYVDTSVIGGCEAEEFREPSRRLIRRFTQGELTLVLSPLVVEELRASPRRVREVLLGVPAAHIETLEVTPAADALAAKYIERGALTQRMLPDALHIANAAIAQVDVLVSWNFKHVVNLQRIRTFNEVNREMGYGPLDIRSPREVAI